MSRNPTLRDAFFWYALPGGLTFFIIFSVWTIATTSLPDIISPSAAVGSLKIAFYFFGILVGPIVGGLVSFLAAGLLEWAFRLTVPERFTLRLRTTLVSFVVASYAILLIPPLHDFYIMQKTVNEENIVRYAPQVKIDSGEVAGTRVDSIPGIVYDWSRNRLQSVGRIGGAISGKSLDFTWNGRECVFSLEAGVHYSYQVSLKDGKQVLRQDMSEYRFVTGSSFVLVPSDSSSWLFVLSQIRVSSLRSVLDVFAADGRLVYEELVPVCDFIEAVEVEGVGTFVVLGRWGVPRNSIPEIIDPHPIAYRIVPASDRPLRAGIQ
jgi:hypothetical protein